MKAQDCNEYDEPKIEATVYGKIFYPVKCIDLYSTKCFRKIWICWIRKLKKVKITNEKKQCNIAVRSKVMQVKVQTKEQCWWLENFKYHLKIKFPLDQINI